MIIGFFLEIVDDVGYYVTLNIKLIEKIMTLPSYLKKNTVTRETLARAIKRETGLAINRASHLVDQFLDTLVDAVCKNRPIKIRLFGTFVTRLKKARIGRNPKTLEQAQIPARKIVKFKVAPTLKKRINSNIHLIH